MEEFTLIGKSIRRVDTAAKATGEVQFSADMLLPRMLTGKVLRSPYPHAKISSIDTSKAERLPGVKAVVTGRDSSGEKWGVFRYTQDMEFPSPDRVRYIGEEVAAVAAVDEETALAALDLIDVEYEQLPAYYTIDDTIADGACLIHDLFPGNINVHVKVDVGDVEKGFSESYLVREDTFRAPEESYFMAEPFAVVAQFDSSGNLDIWSPNAGPHMKSKPLSNILKMPLHKVRVRKIAIGGAFGGRSEISAGDAICALLARKSKRPVKIVYSREENSIATRQAHGMKVRVKTGVDKEGRVIARDIECYMDGGAYSSTGPIAVSVPFLCMEQAYRMENVRYNGYRVFTNKTPRGMWRCHGRAFAGGVDLQLDMIGKELGIDPVTMRLRNSRQPGDYTPTKSFIQSCAMDETINKTAEASGWKEKFGKLPAYHGIGIGTNSLMTGFPMGIRGGSEAFVKFNEDGGVTVVSGICDNGQGNDQMIVQITADVLGLLPEDVQLVTADTEVTPTDPGSYSQSSTFVGGNAVRRAAEDLRDKLFALAAKKLEAKPEDMAAAQRKIFVKNQPERFLSVAKVVRMALAKGLSISGSGVYWPRVDPHREWVENPTGQLAETFTFGAVIVEVRVDPETGQVEVLEAWNCQDVGRAINPKIVEGQWEGGFAQGGQGGMLTEYHLFDAGRVLNPTQLEYKVPLACDMPKINNIIVESQDQTGPFGAKEAGMSISMCAAQAYSGAICNALGVWIKEFPITPDKILKAIEEKKGA